MGTRLIDLVLLFWYYPIEAVGNEKSCINIHNYAMFFRFKIVLGTFKPIKLEGIKELSKEKIKSTKKYSKMKYPNCNQKWRRL